MTEASSSDRLGLIRSLRAVNPRTRVLILGFFLANLSNFMVVPLLALYLHVYLAQPAQRVGLVLTALILTQQGLPVLTGFLSDRWGGARVLVLGIASRALGFICFALAHRLAPLLLAGLLVGLGGAAFTPAAKAMVAQAAGSLRVQAFALRYAATNAGAALGPLLGGALFGRFQFVCLAAAGLYLGFGILFARGLDARPPSRPRFAVVAAVRGVVSDRGLLTLTGVSVGFWFLYTQFTFTLPLYGQDRFGLAGRLGALFALNAVTVILLQFPLAVRLSSVMTGWRMLVIGSLSLLGGFIALASLQSVPAMILFTLLFSVGEMLIVPTLDTLASKLASEITTGSYFGFVSLGWALGGLLGNLGGGLLYAWLRSGGTYQAFWLANAILAAATCFAFILLDRRYGQPGS